jgi:hypothetical protein
MQNWKTKAEQDGVIQVRKRPFGRHFILQRSFNQDRLGTSIGETLKTSGAFLQYGKDFMAQLAPVYTGGETKNGGMITSCICHGCPWAQLQVNDGTNKTSYQHCTLLARLFNLLTFLIFLSRACLSICLPVCLFVFTHRSLLYMQMPHGWPARRPVLPQCTSTRASRMVAAL